MTNNKKNLKSKNLLIYINLSSFNTENTVDISLMFYGHKNLSSINLNSFNTEKIFDMSQMIYNCENLIVIN